ncbi:MAG: hypothetical protein LAO03_07975 [Acidobacteriia bacterium]|nr:hypothetical protein [Terriglobia bacterium]
MGNKPEVRGSLAIMAEVLCSEGTPEQIRLALARCAKECRYPVRIPDILQRIPGREVPQAEAQMRRAWDDLMAFVAKYVSNDVHGAYGPEHGWWPKSYPKLSVRIVDTVRRTGGWRVYKLMTAEDFPHQQKRFFEEFLAWSSVQQTPSMALPAAAAHQLGPGALTPIEFGKPIPAMVNDQPGRVAFFSKEAAAAYGFKFGTGHREAAPSPQYESPVAQAGSGKAEGSRPVPKTVPAPLTDAQRRDRRAMLRQQAAAAAKKFPQRR